MIFHELGQLQLSQHTIFSSTHTMFAEVREDLMWCPCSVENVLPGVFFLAADALLAQSVKACWLHDQDFGILTLFSAYGCAVCCRI